MEPVHALSLVEDTPFPASPRANATFSVRLLAAQEYDLDAAVLCVHGEIDLSTEAMLREVLRPVLDHGAARVVVDLSEVGFMDSTGVHVLMDALERLETQNRRLAIACREGSQVHGILALAGQLDALTVHPSRESALIDRETRTRTGPAAKDNLSYARAGTRVGRLAARPGPERCWAS